MKLFHKCLFWHLFISISIHSAHAQDDVNSYSFRAMAGIEDYNYEFSNADLFLIDTSNRTFDNIDNPDGIAGINGISGSNEYIGLGFTFSHKSGVNFDIQYTTNPSEDENPPFAGQFSIGSPDTILQVISADSVDVDRSDLVASVSRGFFRNAFIGAIGYKRSEVGFEQESFTNATINGLFGDGFDGQITQAGTQSSDFEYDGIFVSIARGFQLSEKLFLSLNGGLAFHDADYAFTVDVADTFVILPDGNSMLSQEASQSQVNIGGDSLGFNSSVALTGLFSSNGRWKWKARLDYYLYDYDLSVDSESDANASGSLASELLPAVGATGEFEEEIIRAGVELSYSF